MFPSLFLIDSAIYLGTGKSVSRRCVILKSFIRIGEDIIDLELDEYMKEIQMKRISKLIIIFAIALVILLPACTLWQSPPLPIATPTATMAATATEPPTAVPPTNTPLPTQTNTVAPTATVAIPTMLPPTTTPTKTEVTNTNTEYSCDIIDQSPSDDTKFTSGDDFDIKWTIINNGTEKWRDGTILKYQSGPHMTTQTNVALPSLKPDETYVVSFDAKASGKGGSRQVMLWAVIGPGKNGSSNIWMCYPYIRILIK
jgi:hypothetical protein